MDWVTGKYLIISIQKKSKIEEILIGLIQKFILILKDIKKIRKEKIIEINFTK